MRMETRAKDEARTKTGIRESIQIKRSSRTMSDVFDRPFIESTEIIEDIKDDIKKYGWDAPSNTLDQLELVPSRWRPNRDLRRQYSKS